MCGRPLTLYSIVPEEERVIRGVCQCAINLIEDVEVRIGHILSINDQFATMIRDRHLSEFNEGLPISAAIAHEF